MVNKTNSCSKALMALTIAEFDHPHKLIGEAGQAPPREMPQLRSDHMVPVNRLQGRQHGSPVIVRLGYEQALAQRLDPSSKIWRLPLKPVAQNVVGLIHEGRDLRSRAGQLGVRAAPAIANCNLHSVFAEKFSLGSPDRQALNVIAHLNQDTRHASETRHARKARATRGPAA
jgi:hypothetical protein